jgi:hypothetical protein
MPQSLVQVALRQTKVPLTVTHRRYFGVICGALHPQVSHFRQVPFDSARFHDTAAHILSMVTVAAFGHPVRAMFRQMIQIARPLNA